METRPLKHYRFQHVVGPQLQLYNYYSTGEDALNNLDTGTITFGRLWRDVMFHHEFAFCIQELWKGRHRNRFGGSLYGGWGFSTDYNVPDYTNSAGRVFYKHLSAAQAAMIPNDQLKTNTFFNNTAPVPLVCQDPNNSGGAGSIYARAHQNELLARMIPALSFATGKNELTKLNFYGARNFDMNDMENDWPQVRVSGWSQRRWLHGDYRAVSYVYVYKVFDDIQRKMNP